MARQIIGGSALSIGVRIGGVALSYLVSIALSRILGLAGYGAYMVYLGWALVLLIPARLGFDYSALRYVTTYLATRNWPALRGFIRLSIVSVLGLSLLVGLAMIAIAIILRAQAGIAIVVAAALLIGALALLGILSVMLRSAGRLFESQFHDQLLRPAVLLLLVTFWAMAGLALDPARAMFITAAAAWIAVATLAWRFRRTFQSIWATPPVYADLRAWYGLSLPLLGVAVAQEMLNQLELILLGWLAGPEEAGLFAAAARLASLMTFALAALGIVTGPMIAAAHQRADRQELQDITTFTARLGLLFAVGVAAFLGVAGGLLLDLFGPDFRPAYGPLMILVAGGLVNGFTGVVVYLMTLTGRERPALAIFSVALALSFTLNLLLIPRFGVIGAAIAASTSLAFWNLAVLGYVRLKMGIDASALGWTGRAGPR